MLQTCYAPVSWYTWERFSPYFVSGSEIARSKGMNIFYFIKYSYVFCKEDMPVSTSNIRVWVSIDSILGSTFYTFNF